jgi:hypothetical protein
MNLGPARTYIRNLDQGSSAYVNGIEVAVAVPVRNEVAGLPRLLRALARQRAAPPFALCLHLDNCGDGSAALVAAADLPFPVRVSEAACGAAPNAGRARARAAALGRAVAPDGVLLSTDADSEPGDDWIAANLAGLRHADLVAGRIIRAGGRPSPLQDRTERYLDRLHALRRRRDPVNWEAPVTHGWTSAASLAMRVAAYDACGGFEPRPTGEDAALADAAARRGFTLRRDAAAVVRTSARRRGRVVGGFAAALAAADARRLPIVAHPADEAWRYDLQAQARALHGGGDYADLARRLGLPLAEVRQVADECVNGEAFAARIVGPPAGGLRHVPLPLAERLLAALEDAALKGAA